MSMQSDAKSLSIQALENYAKIHNLSENDAVGRLRYSKINNQVSFHTPRALEYLHFEYRKEIAHD